MAIGYASFIPRNTPLLGHDYYETPAYRVDIEGTLHDQLIYTSTVNWTPTVTADKKTLTESGANLVYCDPKSTNNTLTLNTTVDIIEKGYYRIYLRLKRGALSNSSPSTLSVGTKDYKFSGYQEYSMVQRLDLGKQYLQSGSLDLELILKKWTYVEQIIIQRIIPMSTHNIHGTRRINTNNIDFTSNNISEMNTFSLTSDAIPLAWPNGHYHKNNEVFNLVQDFGSSVTISLGETKNDLRPVFGGYITKVDYSHENGTFQLSGPDRLYDMIREPSYYNNILGAATSTVDKKDYPDMALGDIYDAGKYVCQTIEYPIRTDQIYYKNLEASTDFSNKVNINFKTRDGLNYIDRNPGFILEWDTTTGYPAPGLKVTQGTKMGDTYFTPFNNPSDPVKLSQYPVFLFDYMALNSEYTKVSYNKKTKKSKSKTYKSPLLFDIELTIHKEGETIANALTYYIPFSSQERHPLTLCSAVNYKCNGEWQRFMMNIKNLMDNYSPSGEYYLSKIRFVNYNNWDETYYNTVPNVAYKVRKKYKSGKNKGKYYYVTKYKRVHKTMRQNRQMWFDNIITTTTEAASKSKSGTDIGTPFEFLQKGAEDTNHSIWLMPGVQRKDDALIISPNKAEIIDTTAVTGTNILGISDITNAPQESICNQSTKRFNLTDDITSTTYYGDRNHSIHYGPLEKYEVQSDNDSWLIANTNAYYQVQDNLAPGWGFNIDINGVPDLPINQYLSVEIPHIPWLNGEHQIMSVESSLNFTEDSIIKSSVGLNKPSKRYLSIIREMKKELFRNTLKNKLALTSTQRSRTLGGNSPGATI